MIVLFGAMAYTELVGVNVFGVYQFIQDGDVVDFPTKTSEPVQKWTIVFRSQVHDKNANQMLAKSRGQRPWTVNKTGTQADKVPSKDCKSHANSCDDVHRLLWRNAKFASNR